MCALLNTESGNDVAILNAVQLPIFVVNWTSSYFTNEDRSQQQP